jgi:UDP-N-acetylglucosamine 4,6-dehydratase
LDHNLDASIVCITGGTGSFGSTMVKHLLESTKVAEIRIFSRDENKQDNLRRTLDDARCKFFIGDTRDDSNVRAAIRGANFVFHAAALKQVPSCEFFPDEAIKTNVNGSQNVIQAALDFNADSLVCLSTDKAVYPINAMGMSKALMERIAQAKARGNQNSHTRISITRYGNVLMSRGSVIPHFIDQISKNKPVTITNPEMTRFLMSLEASVSLVKFAFAHSTSGDLFVRKAPAADILTLAKAVHSIVSPESDFKSEVIGTRHGEKVYESLLGVEESSRCIDLGDYFRVPLDTRSLDYSAYFEQGNQKPKEIEAYTSHNTYQMSESEVKNLLLTLPEFESYATEIR